MYNEEIKNKFLNSTGVDENQFARLFKETFKTENELSKDLYDFDVEEILSISNKQEDFVMVSDYVEWVVCQGYRKSLINVAELFLVEYDDDEE